MTRFQRYLLTKVVWFTVAFFAALALNFYLPRLIPGNPVDAIMADLAAGGTGGQAQQRIYEAFVKEFGLDQPVWRQFFTYLGNLVRGDLGTSFTLYPAPVSDLIGDALPWTIALQVPAILIGWTLGNVLGALAAYRGGWTDRGAFI